MGTALSREGEFSFNRREERLVREKAGIDTLAIRIQTFLFPFLFFITRATAGDQLHYVLYVR